MKKRWLSIYAIMAMILVLAACSDGNNTDNSNEDNNSTTDPVEIEENDNNDDINLEEDEESSDEDSTTDGTSTEENAEDNKTDETPKDDEELVEGTDDFLNEAEQVESDEQDYSIYLLPNYTLTSEEPGRDSLFSDEDGTIFMRIETMTAEDGTYDYLHENMLTILAASGNEATEPVKLEDEVSLPSGESIENAVAYTVNSETGPVTGMIFEREGMIVRLTIFDSPDAQHFNNFLSMGETIIQTN